MRFTWLVMLLTCCLAMTGCAETVNGSAVAVPSGPRSPVSCTGGQVVQPRGAPYCYLKPTGFEVTYQITTGFASGQNARYISAVGIDVHDLVTVVTYPLGVNTDPMDTDALEFAVGQETPDPATHDYTVGEATMTTVDGARTVQMEVDELGHFSSTLYFAFRGHTAVEIDCQWTQRQAEIAKGCAAVLSTLRFVDPPH